MQGRLAILPTDLSSRPDQSERSIVARFIRGWPLQASSADPSAIVAGPLPTGPTFGRLSPPADMHGELELGAGGKHRTERNSADAN
jgi:hypothetical protein